MKLEEAIKINELKYRSYPLLSYPDIADAIKLGIEAMKYRQAVKKAGYIDLDDLLPGETKD